jgi:hypothetical protein
MDVNATPVRALRLRIDLKRHSLTRAKSPMRVNQPRFTPKRRRARVNRRGEGEGEAPTEPAQVIQTAIY